jgi:putative nucleotidyltransferase with HDIG domain
MTLQITANRRRLYYTLLFILGSMLALAAVLAPMLADALAPPLQEGQIAARDYRAPRAISYVSEIRTEQRRRTAEQAVVPIYTLPDTRVARRQMELLRAALAYIQSVRSDAYASPEQKRSDLAALEEAPLKPQTIEAILDLNDARWQAIQQEALTVLERTMSSIIRPEAINEARGRIPAIVSLSFSEDQAGIVADLVSAFVSPNSQYSEELTLAARQKAREAMEPASRTFIPGQTIILQGELVDAEDIEALENLGLIQPQTTWNDLVGAIAITLVMAVLVVFYLRRKHTFIGDMRRVTVVVFLGLFFLLSVRLIIPAHTIIPFAFPIAAYGVTLAVLFGVEQAVVLSLPVAILAAYSLSGSLELSLYYVVTSLFGVLALGKARRLLSFAWAGVAVGVSGALVILAYRLPQPTADLTGIATLVGVAFLNGLGVATVTIVLHTLLAHYLSMVTALQLIDLMRPDHPLLRTLLREAPGTYQHSLQVANLAEQAAERIGADPLLTRIGALYHDIGKTLNPVYFIENQPPGFANPHEQLTPEESATIIIQHIKDGYELGRKYHLPLRILDFVNEHHGTGLTRYQYYNALQAEGGDESRVDKARFRYPGPRPQSRETAILMLADGAEARVRAERPADDQKLVAVIKSAISDRVASGQLDDTRLTLSDLNQIGESFAATLRGVYHPRLHYPRLDAASPEAITLPISRPVDLSVEERR